jgi:adenosylhomocysteine nucleosidase
MDTTATGDVPGLLSGINMVELPASRRLSSLALNTALEQGSPCARGVIASGDQFISSVERKDYIRTTFGAIACEMEGAAVGHVCYLAGVEFVIIRCISDSATGTAEMEYPEMVKRAAAKSEALVLAMLEAMED